MLLLAGATISALGLGWYLWQGTPTSAIWSVGSAVGSQHAAEGSAASAGHSSGPVVAGGAGAGTLIQSPESQTGSAPVVMPRPVPLGREARDPKGAARMAASQAADHQRQMADSAAPRLGQQLHDAQVSAQDIGIAFLPDARQDRRLTSRADDPGYGRTISTQLSSHASLNEATNFYREQLRRQFPKATIEEQRDRTGLVVLAAGDADARSRVTVLLHASGGGQLDATLTRWDAGPQMVAADTDQTR